MAQVTIPWESGGGSITASFNGEGTGRLDLSATANADEQGNERTVTIATTSGGVERTATVRVMQMGTRLPRRVIYVYDTASENPVEGVTLTVNGEEMTTDAAGEVTLSTVERLTVKMGDETYEYPSTVRDSLYGLAYSSMEYRVKVAVRCSTFNAACIGEDVATITMNGETKSTPGGETHGEAIFTGLEPGVTYPVTVVCSGQTYESEVTVDPGVPDKVHKVVVDRWFERYRPTPNGRFQMAIRFTGAATSKSVTMKVSSSGWIFNVDTIYWGDGSSTTIQRNVSTYDHTYSGEIDVWQVYNIEVTTKKLTSNPIIVNEIGAYNNTNVLVAFYNPGGSTNSFNPTNNKNMSYFDASFANLISGGFNECNYLVGIPDADYQYDFNLNSLFYRCWNLVRVPSKMLVNTTMQNQGGSITNTFRGVALQELPDGFFQDIQGDLSLITSMRYLFNHTSKGLKRIPTGIFEGFSGLTDIAGAFTTSSTCETFDNDVFSGLPDTITQDNLFMANNTNLRRVHMPGYRITQQLYPNTIEEIIVHGDKNIGNTIVYKCLLPDGIAYVPDEYLDDYRAGWPDFPAERVRPMSQLPPFVEKLALENAPVD